MKSGNSEMAGGRDWWRHNIPVTTTPDVARERLEAILSDRLFRFNPYRVSDRDLTKVNDWRNQSNEIVKFISHEGVVTGIESVVADSADADTREELWFNMQGVRVA